MKKFLFILFGVFGVVGAFAAGENIPTSKSYVDAAVATKQDTIPANDGVAMVLTNTGTVGEYGTKGIYDSTNAYSGQTDALIDAVTMNTAVQNAIDSEFQCISWVDDDPTKDCLLVEIRGTPSQSILPTGYTALEYIESTGTQYIDTGVNNTGSIGFETDIQVNVYGEIERGVFGTSASLEPNHYVFQVHVNTTDANGLLLYMRKGGPDHLEFANPSVTGFHKYAYNVNNDDKAYRDNTYIGTIEHISVAINYPFYLFARDVSGLLKDNSGSSITMKYFKIYRDGEMVRNFIPARRDSDGEIGMYDMVTNTFFTNAGTGEFIAGSVVNLYLPAGE